jgi:predicted nucleic-acid-binding protein
MLAVDTNVLVRLLTPDDSRQAARAASLLHSEEIWVAKTVLLETEWVLRSLYDFGPESVVAALRGLSGLVNIHLEDPLAVAKALDWSSRGLEFADALHVASAGEAKRFTTFDGKFSRAARRLGSIEVEIVAP